MRAITPELAKAVLDALHDRKHNAPHYKTTGARAPLPDDDQRFVIGLAIELVASPVPGVDFTLASSVGFSGEIIASLAVDAAAPNDVAGSAAEEAVRKTLRNQFAHAVITGLGRERPELAAATALIVSHGPQRDEDNTWATWIGALTRGGSWLEPARSSALPASWRPTAIASLSERSLGARVRYDFLR